MRKIIIIIMLVFSAVIISAGVFAASLPITSYFGWRNDPFTNEWKFHAGVDFGFEEGSAIPALFDGTVVRAGDYQDGYGNCVLLYHPEKDAYTKYAHCLTLYVQEGDAVFTSDIIAAVGSTGRSTGPHLHLEYIINTEDGYQYTDPLILWYRRND